MTVAHALIIAAALIAGALLVRSAWTQNSYTASFATGIVVSSCSAVTPPFNTGLFTYANKTQAPITLNPGGEICVSQ